jgi:hypothetical protein
MKFGLLVWGKEPKLKGTQTAQLNYSRYIRPIEIRFLGVVTDYFYSQLPDQLCSPYIPHFQWLPEAVFLIVKLPGWAFTFT